MRTVGEGLEWGDVVFQGDGVVVCEATLDGERVLAKRWQGDVLDAELAARELAAGAGLPTAELLGSGPGLLVLEDLDQSMWRPAHPDDLADPRVAAALGRWLARLHALPAPGLPGSPLAELLDPDLVSLAVRLDGGDAPGGLLDELARASTLLVPPVLALGALSLEGIRVMGAGMDALVDEFSVAHAGSAAADLVLARAVLAPSAWPALLAAHRDASRATGAHVVEDQELAAAGLCRAAAHWVAGVLAGGVQEQHRSVLASARVEWARALGD